MTIYKFHKYTVPLWYIVEAATGVLEVFYKKVFLEISQNAQENNFVGVSLLPLLKRDSDTDVFLQISRNF